MCSLFREMEGGVMYGGPRALENFVHPHKIHYRLSLSNKTQNYQTKLTSPFMSTR